MKKRKLAICLVGVLASGFAFADPFGYEGMGNGSFGSVDLNTGAFTAIGSGFGQTPAGLGSYAGVLYATSYNSNGTLYSVNTATGQLTAIGNSGIFYEGGFGSTTSGLYGVGSNGDLYSINPTNGSAIALGPIGVPIGAWRDLSTGGSQLYYGNGPDLFSMNVTTGAATSVGAFGAPAAIGAMVFENGTMYAGDQGRQLIDTVNLTTGAATPIVGATAASVWGLAPLTSPVPEPTPLLLLVSGLCALALSKGSFRRR